MYCVAPALAAWRRLPRLLPFLLLFVPSVIVAQLEPPSTGGFAVLDQELRMLGHHERVLLIAAHPDDEDTELLTLLTRGMGAEAAYLSLNRGEGGQNLIGEELGEGLGLLRTEELLAARQLDGARQYFTRAYDFGFSKNLDDTWAHWPRDSVLKDVVRIVRRFRPQIVVSIFSGTPRDGHGQHQAAGWAAQEAYRIAGDSTRFPELEREEGLAPWTPLKLYRSARFDTAATTLRLDGGVIDPAVGQSYHQIAMRGRSLHRSQDMGQLQGIGPSVVRLALLDDRTGRGAGALFAGVDTALSAMPWGSGASGRLTAALSARLVALLDSARGRGGVPAPDTMVYRLLGAVERDAGLAGVLPPYEWGPGPGRAQWTGEQIDFLSHLRRARLAAGGFLLDATVDQPRAAPGQSLTITLSARAGGRVSGVPVSFGVESVGGGYQAGARPNGVLTADSLQTSTLNVSVPDAATATATYFRRTSSEAAMYDWSGARPSVRGLPFAPPPFRAVFQVDGMSVSREPAYHYNDQGRGEIRRPLMIVPRVDVKLDPATEVWRAGSVAPQHFSVTLTNGSRDTTTGELALELPRGWPAVTPRHFSLARENERQVLDFEVRAPAGLTSGAFAIHAVATVRGTRFDHGLVTVDYPHIRPRNYVRPATAQVTIAPLALPALRHLGYVRGAADRVPEALLSIGLPVELITGQDLASRDLGRYDVIVIGPRAWETDPDLPGANDRLLAYARSGGTVLVQYQQYGYFLGDFAPFPMTVGSRQPGTTTSTTTTAGTVRQAPAGTALLGGHDRVTDETAPVRVVDSASPIVRTPNRITAKDWEGWVQERGLYFAHSWDAAWKPVFEMHDPGETPLEGGLLIARTGKGRYVYTGLAFFRQLPAGVPGAYRLFANLLALGRGYAR